MIQQALSDVQTEIDNVLRNLYRVPLAFNVNQYLFVTTLNGATTLNSAAGTLTATGANIVALDNLPFWLQPGDAIYMEPGTGRFERQVLQSVNATTGAFTIASPVGATGLQYTGFQSVHGSATQVIASKSLDLIFIIASRLAFANLVDIYYSASSPKGINEQAAVQRHYAESLLADIVTGNTAFTDLVTAGERPMYPMATGATIGNPKWTTTIGDPGTPAFQKETGIHFLNGAST